MPPKRFAPPANRWLVFSLEKRLEILAAVEHTDYRRDIDVDRESDRYAATESDGAQTRPQIVALPRSGNVSNRSQ